MKSLALGVVSGERLVVFGFFCRFRFSIIGWVGILVVGFCGKRKFF